MKTPSIHEWAFIDIIFDSVIVGCIVWGRWTNQLYYHGRVTSISDGKIHVQFDDGDRISHSITDTNAVLEDIVSNPYHVHVGSRVIAAFENRPHYYQGRVAQVDWMNPQVVLIYCIYKFETCCDNRN